MDASLDNRLELATLEDGFDPVSEIRRLRQDLMLRLQRLRQSAADVEGSVVKVEELASLHRAALAKSKAPSESGTVLYDSSDFQRPDNAPATEDPAVSVDPPSGKPKIGMALRIVEQLPPESVARTIAEETVVDLSESVVDSRKESLPAQILGWINAVLVCIGVVGAVAGLYNYVFRNHLTGLQELAITLLVVGAAMVLVGTVGRLSHQHARLQFAGTTGPGSW